MVIEAPEGWWATGPGAAPLLVREARSKGLAPTLAALTASQGDAVFLDPRSRTLHYSAAGLWIRFLVELGGEAGFESYLQGVASGGPFGLEALESAMAADASQLEAIFWGWFDELGEQPQAPTAPSGSSSRQSDVPSG